MKTYQTWQNSEHDTETRSKPNRILLQMRVWPTFHTWICLCQTSWCQRLCPHNEENRKHDVTLHPILRWLEVSRLAIGSSRRLQGCLACPSVAEKKDTFVSFLEYSGYTCNCISCKKLLKVQQVTWRLETDFWWRKLQLREYNLGQFSEES